jgi:glycosyltransferase involved in cell wall biosynthesis
LEIQHKISDLCGMQVSIVIPLKDEAESLTELEAWIRQVLTREKLRYEILFIDDGSSDNSWAVIEHLKGEQPDTIRAIKFRRNYGKSAALHTGFAAAQGQVVITMDADLQDNPDEVPELYRMIVEEKYDLVSGWKKIRHDPPGKTIPSKLFNAVAAWMSGIPLHDFNCGLKAYRGEVAKAIDVYGDLHRWLPVQAKWAGFKKIGEKIVEHRPRKYGYSKFGWERFITGFLDLLSVYFVGRFGKKPMHFFGTFGVFFFLTGFVVLGYLSYLKLVYNQWGIAERPAFFLGIVSLIVGIQLFLTGFVAELLNRNSPHRDHYLIDKTL